MQFLAIIYALVLVYTIARILLDTNSTPKTLAYLLLVFMIPGIGILVYFSFGNQLPTSTSHIQKRLRHKVKIDAFFQSE